MRKSIGDKLRDQVLTRDNNVCQKCASRNDLELHHVIPVADGGANEVDNLVTICSGCHNEWEHLIYIKTHQIDFREWLKIPPAYILISLFTNPEYWRDDVSAKGARDAIVRLHKWIAPDYKEEYEEIRPKRTSKRAKKGVTP